LLSSLFSPDDDSSFSTDHLLAALLSTSTTCFFYHNTCHTAEACPLLLQTKSNPFAKHIVLRLLQDQPLKPTRSLGPHSSLTSTCKPPAHSSLHVHALGLDATMPPDDSDDPFTSFSSETPPDDSHVISDPTPDMDGDLDF